MILFRPPFSMAAAGTIWKRLMARDRFLKIKTFDHKNTEERGFLHFLPFLYRAVFIPKGYVKLRAADSIQPIKQF